MEEMDIDPSPPSGQPASNPPSPEKKRKHGETDHKSSKRRKHGEDSQPGVATNAVGLTENQPLEEAKKREKREKKEKKEKEKEEKKERKEKEKEEKKLRKEKKEKEKRDKKEKKEKKAHDLNRSKTPRTPSPSSQLRQDPPSERSSHKKHEKRKEEIDYSTPPSAQRPSTHGRSPLPSRKPLANATAAQSSQADTTVSPFQLITSTLYLPLSPISISPTHALSSLLVEHVSPLLLTYYPPLQGIILAYSNPSISSSPLSTSSTPPKPQDSNPQPLTLATSANEYGVLYVYLTATFLVFRPERSQTLEGWINVQSEGFLGAVVFNLFSVGIERSRLPAGWKWIPPGHISQKAHGDQMDTSSESGYPTTANTTEAEEESDSDKENHFKPLPSSASVNFADPTAALAEDEEEASSGYFQTPTGKRVRGTIRFRVKDIDVIPGSERDKGFLSIEGTMLSEEEEARLVEEERKRFTLSMRKSAQNKEQRGNGIMSMLMSGGLPENGVGPTPTRSEMSASSAEAAPKKTKAVPQKADTANRADVDEEGGLEKFQRKKSVVRKKGTTILPV